MNHECTGDLEVAARKALDAANEFWNAKEATGLGAAVQWIRDDAGGLLIFTRAEYRETLMQNIEEVRDLGRVVTFGDQLDAIELAAEVTRLQGEIDRLQQTCDEFRSASLLVGVAGDAEGVQPHHVESHISELRAIVDKIPKTVDGVPVIAHEHPTVLVFTKRTGLYRPGEGADWWEMIVDSFDGERLSGMVAGSHMASFRPEECFSSYKAQQAAKEVEG